MRLLVGAHFFYLGGVIMALIICPECGRQISDKAACCIGCGCPMNFIVKEIKEQRESHEQEQKKIEVLKPPYFTKDYILSIVPYEAIYERGKNYYIDDRIKNFQYSNAYKIFSSNVLGTNLYKCQIKTNNNKVTDFSCSCPFHQDNKKICKH